jgi:hypothetical protein
MRHERARSNSLVHDVDSFRETNVAGSRISSKVSQSYYWTTIDSVVASEALQRPQLLIWAPRALSRVVSLARTFINTGTTADTNPVLKALARWLPHE